MRIVLQRVKAASVSIAGRQIADIENGILILLGIHRDDGQAQADFLAARCAELRIFDDHEGKMNRSLLDTNGEALVVSQFTLFGDCRKGRRPSYIEAAEPGKGARLYGYFVERLKTAVPVVKTGIFGAMMDVSLVNDGPVTLILEK